MGRISDYVKEMEQENERLSNLVDAMTEELEVLRQNPSMGECEQAKDYLISLLEPDIIWAENNLKAMGPKQKERMKEVVTVYRTIKPPKDEKEGD
jgi:hypothetical protein